MITNTYMLEQLNIQHRQQMMQAAEHRHVFSMADSQQPVSHRLPILAGKLGLVLLKLGTTLKEYEHSQVVATSGKSR